MGRDEIKAFYQKIDTRIRELEREDIRGSSKNEAELAGLLFAAMEIEDALGLPRREPDTLVW